MSAHVRLERGDDGVVELIIDVLNRRANVLSAAVVEGLDLTLDDLADQNGVRVLVIRSGKPHVFLSGPDLAEVAALDDPSIAVSSATRGQSLLRRLEQLPFPVVAVIQGACLGGGLELALACTYRLVANAPTTRLGLPEVTVGLIPALGGTQRLPRLIGIRRAVAMLLDGSTVNAMTALGMGLVDEVLDPTDFWSRARERSLAIAKGLRPRRQRHSIVDTVLSAFGPARDLYLMSVERRVRRAARGQYPAPLSAISSIREGMRRTLDEGLEVEASLAGTLAVTPACKGLIRAQQIATQLEREPGVDIAAARPIAKVGIIGAGSRGRDLATALINDGLDVRLHDLSLEALRLAQEQAYRGLLDGVARNPEPAVAIRRLSPTLTEQGFARADLILLALPPDPEKERATLQLLAKRVSTATVFATLAATPLGHLNAGMARPDRLLGMRFPAAVDESDMVEVVCGEDVSQSALATVVVLAKRLGKMPILVADSPGLLVARIQIAGLVEALELLHAGADMVAVDRAMTDFGMREGPFAAADRTGLEVVLRAARSLRDAFPERFPEIPLLSAMLERGWQGRAHGLGFYVHRSSERNRAKRERQLRPNRRMKRLLKEVGAGADPAAVARGSVQERIILAMVNEAMHALGDGVVGSAAVVDLATILGVGFPPFRGGLLTFGSGLGIASVVSSLERLETELGERFRPAPHLRSLLEAGKTLVDR